MALPSLSLTAIFDVVDGSLRVSVEKSDFLLIMENIVACDCSSALSKGTKIDLPNQVPL